jgi:hypothetical protein
MIAEASGLRRVALFGGSTPSNNQFHIAHIYKAIYAARCGGASPQEPQATAGYGDVENLRPLSRFRQRIVMRFKQAELSNKQHL